jgi:phage tail sheath protein FI
MPVVSFPGVYWTEEGGIPIVAASSPDIGGFEGLFKRGLTTALGFVASWGDFTTLYGTYENSTQNGEYMGPHAVKQFFDNGGSACWINRVVNSTDVAATYVPATADATVTFLTISAVGLGEGGNDLSIGFTKQATTLSVQWLFGDVTVTLTSIQGFEIGDIIVAGGNEAMIQAINPATNVATIIAVGGAAPAVPVDTAVYTTSTHRVTTTLAVPAALAETTVQLTDASRVQVGDVLSINDATNSEQVTVAAVAGNTVTISAIATAAGFIATTPVVSQDFDMRVFENESLLESHAYLNVSATSNDYVQTRLSGTDNQSNLVSVVIGVGAGITDFDFCPINTGQANTDGVSMAAGADTAPPIAAEWTGTAGAGAKTGLLMFDNASRLNFFSFTDDYAVAYDQAADIYAAGREDTMYIAGTYATHDSQIEMYNHVNSTLAIDSSYTAVYGPWYSIADPDIDGATISIPPVGGVQGIYSYTTRNRGVHKAPANVALRGVQSLLFNVSEAEHGLLNPVGCNVIRDFTGQGRGYRVYGARTMNGVEDGFHYVNIRRVVTFIRTAIIEDMQWVVFEPNNYETRSRLYRALQPFLHGLYKQGALWAPEGATPESENGAFWVKCDSENNPPASVEAGQLVCDIGIRATPPAEFVIFNLSLQQGTLTITT